jgi:hypothetical protein
VNRLIAALVAAFALVAAGQAEGSTDRKAPVEVRVVNWKGEIFVDRPVVAQTTSVPTSSKALCFGGTPSDGSKILAGTTALGALQRATVGVAELRPLLLTNAFDFGLGVCAVGRYAPEGEEWWALKVNGSLATTGGDSTFLEAGDRVLWYMDQSYSAPLPDELRLIAPATVRRASLTTVRVLSYDGEGKARPASGAKVFVGPALAGVTDSSGRITVRVTSTVRLVARSAGLIPSNRSVIEVGNPTRQQAGRRD